MDAGDGTTEVLAGTAFLMNGVAGLVVAGLGFFPCGFLVVGSILVAWGVLTVDAQSRPQMNPPPPYPPPRTRTLLGPPGWLSGKSCPACGSNNPPDARLCASCGAPF